MMRIKVFDKDNYLYYYFIEILKKGDWEWNKLKILL
jgi:hypothetical protein